jgi:hypothetical protein
MDVPAVDQLLNTGPDAPQVRREIGQAIASAMVAELEKAKGAAAG